MSQSFANEDSLVNDGLKSDITKWTLEMTKFYHWRKTYRIKIIQRTTNSKIDRNKLAEYDFALDSDYNKYIQTQLKHIQPFWFLCYSCDNICEYGIIKSIEEICDSCVESLFINEQHSLHKRIEFVENFNNKCFINYEKALIYARSLKQKQKQKQKESDKIQSFIPA